MKCGCVGSCCELCGHAIAAGRPRLDSSNAAQWEPPDLNKLRGKKHKAAREADDGEVKTRIYDNSSISPLAPKDQRSMQQLLKDSEKRKERIAIKWDRRRSR